MLDTLRKSVVEKVGFSAPYWLAFSAIFIGLSFGGGTVQWLPSDFICQVFGLVFLALGLAQVTASPSLFGFRAELLLAGILPLAALVQLIPLPPFLWSLLPGRRFLVEEFHTLGATSLPWQPISLSPEATWQSLLSLSLPLSAFLASLLLTFKERRLISLGILAFAIVSTVLGLMQQLGGPDSPLRFYAITNDLLPVGFFANRNHFAAFLYCTLPLSFAWMISMALKPSRARRGDKPDHMIALLFVFAAGVFVALLLMEGLVHSRAGLFITIVSLALSFSLVLPYRKSDAGKRALQTLVVLLVVAVALIGYYALTNVIQQFDRDPIEDVRFAILKGALRALWSFFPFGAGYGTFDAVYQRFELAGNIDAEYINRAHDDIVETMIEGGILSIAVFVLLATWWARRLWGVWTSNSFREASTIDAALARGAAFVPLLLVVHSFLDYPLRTEAIMCLLAFACALTVPPVRTEETAESSGRRRSRSRHRRSERTEVQPRPAA